MIVYPDATVLQNEEVLPDPIYDYDKGKYQEEEKLSVHDAVIKAAGLRLRPILMTTAAMIFGVVPLLVASGPGAHSRFDIGLGRGDSSMRVMGKKPAPLARVAEFTHKVKAMVRGEEVVYGECEAAVQLPWATGYELPVWIGAYGPKALATAGEVGDGVILQIADPSLVKWFRDQAVEAGEAAGRDMSNFKVQAAAPAFFGKMDHCVEHTKWFPAMVGNHVADIVEKYGTDSGLVPKSLTDYIEKRQGYDYSKHGQSDNPYLDFITEDIVKSFCVLGEVEDHITKIRHLEEVGTTQFNIYLDNGDEEEIIAKYGKYIIPEFKK